ncbi:MAG: branched-subunit amino acid permease [Rickettsiales bacterium]|jgi:branched-subunit amino acid permease
MGIISLTFLCALFILVPASIAYFCIQYILKWRKNPKRVFNLEIIMAFIFSIIFILVALIQIIPIFMIFGIFPLV